MLLAMAEGSDESSSVDQDYDMGCEELQTASGLFNYRLNLK